MVTRWLRDVAGVLRHLAARHHPSPPPYRPDATLYAYDPHPATDDNRWAELQARLEADGWAPVYDFRTGDRIGYLTRDRSRRDDDLPDLYVTLTPEKPAAHEHDEQDQP